MERVIRGAAYWLAFPILILVRLWSYIEDAFFVAEAAIRKILLLLAKAYSKKTSGILKLTYVIVCWASFYVCYLKFKEIPQVAPYSYLQILSPVIFICIIAMIESYVSMIKKAIDGSTRRDS